MSKNWRVRCGEMYCRLNGETWVSETVCRLFYPDVYQTRMNEKV